MRVLVLSVPLALFTAAACDVPSDKGSRHSGATGDSGASTPTTDDTGRPSPGDHSGGSVSGPRGWVALPLIDDDRSRPGESIEHVGQDLVTGLHFRNAEGDGVIVTREGGRGVGGAVYHVEDGVVDRILLARPDGDLCLLGALEFGGLTRTDDGYLAHAQACGLWVSRDDGETFAVEGSDATDTLGFEELLQWQASRGVTRALRDNGAVAETGDVPGPRAVWTDIWAPGWPTSPIPADLPADQCQDGPRAARRPARIQVAYAQPHGDFLAYGARPTYAAGPEVCVSRDGGHSFYPTPLPDVPPSAAFFQPDGVHFLDDTVGFAWYGSNVTAGASYLYRTDDGGATFARVDLPRPVDTASIELNHMFFAPGDRVGWLVGANFDEGAPLLLKTTDAGRTWRDVGGRALASATYAAGGNSRLMTGMAVDEDHLWVGGEWGVVLSHDHGGE